jgi:hypothetical protein
MESVRVSGHVLTTIPIILQQDGAPAHHAKGIMHFLRNQGVAGIQDWPPNSPGLFIIENVGEY